MSIFPRRALGLVIMAASTVTGCSRGDAAATQAPAGRAGGQPAGVPVEVAVVEQRAVPLELRAIGSAQAYSVVAIHSQITGELTSVNFKEGDDVQQGQVLFTLDRRPLEAALQTAEGNLERDVAQAANAATSAKRYQDLQTRGIATKEQVDESVTTAKALAATILADQGAVANARVQLQYATIAAPIQGRTGQLKVNPGNLVRANDTTALVTINQVSPIYVAFGLPEGRLDDLRRYLAKGTLHVEAMAPGATDAGSPGKITFIDNQVDPTTGMITVKVEFDNRDHRLWPGRFVNVLVTLAADANAIVVPAVAVQSGQQGDYVFVVKPDRSVEYRKVTIERTVDSNTVVRQGLAAGETVVTDGQLRLTAGTHVTIKDGEGAGAAP
jgi:multidrug efflux system membrane fusion protein